MVLKLEYKVTAPSTEHIPEGVPISGAVFKGPLLPMLQFIDTFHLVGYLTYAVLSTEYQILAVYETTHFVDIFKIRVLRM